MILGYLRELVGLVFYRVKNQKYFFIMENNYTIVFLMHFPSYPLHCKIVKQKFETIEYLKLNTFSCHIHSLQQGYSTTNLYKN